ncbi:MAG: rod shape-determining protein MreD [Acidimicrobiales bacterium]
MNLRKAARVLATVLLALVVQSTVGVDIRIAGVHPDLMLLLPIAAGIAGGPEDGALVGFLAGLAADLLLPTPFGLSALVDCLVGFAVGASTGSLAREIWWLSPLVALSASAAGVLAYAVLGTVLGESQFLHLDLVAMVAVVALSNAVLANVTLRGVRWALSPAPSNRRRASNLGPGW